MNAAREHKLIELHAAMRKVAHAAVAPEVEKTFAAMRDSVRGAKHASELGALDPTFLRHLTSE